MKLFGFHISRQAPVPLKKSITPEQWLRGDDLDPQSSTLSNAYQQVVWVYRAINVLADAVANVPFLFSVGERGRETLITSGALPKFYDHPAPDMNRFQYWELRVIWLMLRGECFRVPIFSGTPSVNSVNSINPANPDVTLQPCNNVTASARSSLSSLRSSRRLRHVIFLDPAH